MSPACRTTPSASRKPAASSMSEPGVRMVTVSARPPIRSSSGSSTAKVSTRVMTWASAGCGASGAPVMPPSVALGGQPDLVAEGLDRVGFLRHDPQDVEGVDVSAALPDAVQRRFAVEPRHPGLLDVAVAAEALESLSRMTRSDLAHVVLGD